MRKAILASLVVAFLGLVLPSALIAAEPTGAAAAWSPADLEAAIFQPATPAEEVGPPQWQWSTSCEDGPVGCGRKYCFCVEDCGGPQFIAQFKCNNPYTCICV